MAFETFNLGNALAQAEQIKGLRMQNAFAQQQQDPNSLQNQGLRQNMDIGAQQLQGLQQKNTLDQLQIDDEKKLQNLYFAHDKFVELKNDPMKKDAISAEFQQRGLPPLQKGPTDPAQIIENAEKGIGIAAQQIELINKRKLAGKVQGGTSGQVQNALAYESGTPSFREAYDKANKQYQLVDNNGQIVAVNPYDLAKGKPPTSSAGITKVLDPKDRPENIAGATAAKETEKAKAEARSDVNKKMLMSKTVVGLLDEADKYIGVATGSTLGNIRDSAGKLIGVSPQGAKAAAKLKAIGGQLTSNQPRMEGPQGVLDVILYQEMAGQVGDPTIPNETRKAAIEVIRQLNEKYLHLNSDQPAQNQLYEKTGGKKGVAPKPVSIDDLVNKYAK